MTESDRKALAEKIKADRPNLKKAVDDVISQLVELIGIHDPLDIVTPIICARAFKGFAADPSDDDTRDELTADVDYLHNLILTIPYPTEPRPVTPEDVQKLHELMDELRSRLTWYQIADSAATNASDVEKDLRHSAVLTSTLLRGSTYPTIARDMYKEVFDPHKDFLRHHYGFDANDVLGVIDAASECIVERFNNCNNLLRSEFEAWQERFSEWSDASGVDHNLDQEEILSKFVKQSPPPDAAVSEQLRQWFTNFGGRSLLLYKPKDEHERKILDVISVEYGDNKEFIGDSKFIRWPLNDSIAHLKPFIRHADNYYLPNSSHAFHSFRTIIEDLIRRADADYLRLTYYPTRHAVTMKMTVQSLSRVFGESCVYSELYYTLAGAASPAELDVLVKYGDVLLFVEAKGAAMSASARRGGVKRLVENLDSIVGEAFDQGLRAKNYLTSQEVATFSNKRGREILRLRSADFTDLTIINVTLEQLWSLSVNHQRLEEAGLLDGKGRFWSISIGDLIAVVDVLQRPSLFLHFLHRRLEIAKLGRVQAHDELDFLMHYVERGLYASEFDKGPEANVLLASFTGKLDNYYMRLEEGLPAIKPFVPIPGELSKVLASIEWHPGHRGVALMLSLLEFDERGREDIATKLEEMNERSLADGSVHTITVAVKGRGMVFASKGGLQQDPIALSRAAMIHRKHRFKETVYASWTVPIEASQVQIDVFKA